MSNSTKQAFRGPLIIISGPSGSGKSTLVKELLKDKSMTLEGAISATTRKKRSFEVDGVDYFFWSKEMFQEEVAKGSFLEWAEVYGNYYGTLISEVNARRMRGAGVVLEIDVQGAGQIRKTGSVSKSIFVVPPDMEACESRLRTRGTETEETLVKRLASAKHEMEQAVEYDFKVINDDLEKAVVKIKDFVRPLFLER
jgi:guanylate kinase